MKLSWIRALMARAEHTEKHEIRFQTEDLLLWILWRMFRDMDSKKSWLSRKSYSLMKKSLLFGVRKEAPELLDDFRKTFFASDYQYRKWCESDIVEAKKIANKSITKITKILKKKGV